MEYAVAVTVVLPWVAMVGTTEVATDRTAARAIATTVALTVEAPCKIETRGSYRGNPRSSTVARGKTHGRPRKCHTVTAADHLTIYCYLAPGSQGRQCTYHLFTAVVPVHTQVPAALLCVCRVSREL